MKLDLRFTTRPVEEIWCDTAVAFVFLGPSGEWEGASNLDVKTSGFLGRLRDRGFWKGDEGETLLVASQDMIKADRILLKGCGARSGFRPETLSTRAEEVGVALKRMAVSDIGVTIPMLEGLEKEYPKNLEAACMHLLGPLLTDQGDDSDALLKVVFSVDESQIDKLDLTLGRLRECLSSELHCTVLIERQGEHPESNEYS